MSCQAGWESSSVICIQDAIFPAKQSVSYESQEETRMDRLKSVHDPPTMCPS